MNWEMIGATGEWAGALAVVVTLVYLSSQIRQAKEATRQADRQMRWRSTVSYSHRTPNGPNDENWHDDTCPRTR